MNKICSLVVLYKGKELTQEAHDAIVTVLLTRGIIESTDDVQIRYYDSEGIADAIIANEHKEESNNNNTVKLHFVTGPNKLQVVKFLKNHFHLDIKEAAEAANTGVITVNSIDYPAVLKGLCKLGGYAKDLSDDIALQQAVIYINERYPNAHLDKSFLSTLIKDILIAKDDSNEFSIALIESARLISNASQEECVSYGLYPTLYGTICVAYNVLTSM